MVLKFPSHRFWEHYYYFLMWNTTIQTLSTLFYFQIYKLYFLLANRMIGFHMSFRTYLAVVGPSLSPIFLPCSHCHLLQTFTHLPS